MIPTNCGPNISTSGTNGWRTLYGLQAHSFPNCFFLGFTQTAISVNVPHALNEQAKHVTYILEQARLRGATRIEATLEAEELWLNEMKSKAKIAERCYAECTPGYYNNEGKLDATNGFFAGTYGAGPIPFFRILEEWRATGRLAGVVLR